MTCKNHKWKYIKKPIHRRCTICGIEQITQWITIPEGVKVGYE